MNVDCLASNSASERSIYADSTERRSVMSEKILIVDDEPSNRNILRQELTHEGYSVVGGQRWSRGAQKSRVVPTRSDYSRLHDARSERVGSPKRTSQKRE